MNRRSVSARGSRLGMVLSHKPSTRLARACARGFACKYARCPRDPARIHDERNTQCRVLDVQQDIRTALLNSHTKTAESTHLPYHSRGLAEIHSEHPDRHRRQCAHKAASRERCMTNSRHGCSCACRIVLGLSRRFSRDDTLFAASPNVAEVSARLVSLSCARGSR